MKKKILVLLLLFALLAVILLSGCLQQKTDKELFLELNNKAKNPPNGKYTYSLAFELDQTQGAGIMGALPGVSSFSEGSTTLYKLKEEKRTVISMNLIGVLTNAAFFEKGGRIIVCSERSAGGIAGVSAGAVSCHEPAGGSTLSTLKLFEPKTKIDLDIIKKFSIRLLGEEKYADRPCHNFLMDVNGEELLGNPLGLGTPGTVSEVFRGMKVRYELCMDKEYGFASHVALTISRYSEILESESKVLKMEMKLREFSENVNESDLKVPADFQLNNVECDSNRVSFDLYAFNDIDAGQLKVTIKPPYLTAFEKQTKYADIPLIAASQTENVSIMDLENISGSVTIEACRGDKCDRESCYIKSTSSKTGIASDCTDTEDGADAKTKGSVTVAYRTAGTTIGTDTCLDSNRLIEYFCTGDRIDSITVQCEAGCSEGECK